MSEYYFFTTYLFLNKCSYPKLIIFTIGDRNTNERVILTTTFYCIIILNFSKVYDYLLINVGFLQESYSNSYN